MRYADRPLPLAPHRNQTVGFDSPLYCPSSGILVVAAEGGPLGDAFDGYIGTGVGGQPGAVLGEW